MKTKPQKVIELVNKGLDESLIKEKLGISKRVSVKKLYYDALVKTGTIKDVIPEKKSRGRSKRKELTIGKRGTILLSKPVLVEQLGFREGDKFDVLKKRDSIVLKKWE